MASTRPNATHLPATSLKDVSEKRLAALLSELRETLQQEIPMSARMGIEVVRWTEHGVQVMLPLEQNRNHQQTAFAGSLNALCTLAGWSTVYLLMRYHGLDGSIVIRRSAIKYLLPVAAPEILAVCRPVTLPEEQFFVEMLSEKGQAKLDLDVEVGVEDGLAVAFHGSYVVLTAEA